MMANIVVAFWSENGKVFYDALAQCLYENGNNVYYLNMRDYIIFQKWGESFKLTAKAAFLEKELQEFSPDLVFSFNNVFPHQFVQNLSCPVCLLDADTPEVGFWNKETLKQYKDRYVFLGFQKVSRELYEKSFGKIKNYLYFPPATFVKYENLDKNINISFIGSNFLGLFEAVHKFNFVYNQSLFRDVLSVYKKIKNCFCSNFDDFKKVVENLEDENYKHCIFNFFKAHRISGYDRVAKLGVLADLGLRLYGIFTWRELLYFDADLALCFDETPVVSLEDNAKIYNSSKISVNISHEQALSAFSWRVMDIMASSACLLMEDKSDWRELFAPYLSDETLENVIYKDRFDMREKAKKLLADEELRLRCVADLNNAIEQNGRWEKRFAMLENFLGVKILNDKNKDSTCIIRKEIEQIVKKEVKLHHKKTFVQRMKFKQRGKNIFYLSCLILAQIPVVDLLFKKKRRQKLLNKVMQYWR